MTRQRAGRRAKAGLVVSEGVERERLLEAHRKRLENSIKRRRRDLERCEEELQEFARAAQLRVEPLLEQSRTLDAEIHELFAEIFRTRKLGKRSRKQIERVYGTLQIDGPLSWRPVDAPGWPGAEPFGDPDMDGAEPMDDGADESGPHQRQPPWRSDPGARERSRGLRDMFLRLAGKFHPDLAGDAETRHKHTEIMKELNRAYREGDAARLVALERDLDKGGATGAQEGSDTELRCARLAAQISLLEQQLEAVATALDELRDSELGHLIEQTRRLSRVVDVDPIELLAQEMAEDVEILQEIHAFVRRFRDREITIAEFLRGPQYDDDDLDEEMDIMDGLDEIMDELVQSIIIMEARSPRPRSTSKRKPGSKRKRRS